MAEEIPGTASPGLTSVLSTWPRWRDGPEQMPQPEVRMPSSSNEVWRVSAGAQQFVVRLNRHPAMRGVDFGLERSILNQLAGADFLPPLVYSDDACLVTGFVEGKTLANTDAHMAALGALFRAIHSAPVSITTRLSVVDHILGYADQVKVEDARLDACIQQLTTVPVDPPDKLTLCHHDLLSANVISTRQGLIALDWEYACLGDPAFDLAVTIESEQFSPQLTDTLLAAYGDISEDFRDRIDQLRPRVALINMLWWMRRSPGRAPAEASVTALAERLGIAL